MSEEKDLQMNPGENNPGDTQQGSGTGSPGGGEVPPRVPPPIINQTPRQQPRRSKPYGKIIAVAVILFLICISVLFIKGCVSFFDIDTAVAGTETGFIETVIEDNHADKKALVIDINGIIYDDPIFDGGASLSDIIKKQLKVAAKDDSVVAVILRINSPGGEVLTADEIYRAIEDFQKKTKKPVIASMGSVAASGGYYIAAPCAWIVANELTITGSIGVILSTWNYRSLMNKVGIKPEVFKSGKFKDMLNGSRDLENMTPEQLKIYQEERKMVQNLIDEVYNRFKEAVYVGRSNAVKNNPNCSALVDNWTEYADGRILSGKQALELGFVDELGNLDTAVKRVKEFCNVSDVNLIQYRIPIGLSNILKLFGSGEAKSVKIDLGFDPPKLQAGKMYFISPTVIF